MRVFVGIYTPNFYIYSSFDGQLNSFQFFAIVNKAAMLSKCPTVSKITEQQYIFSSNTYLAQSLLKVL